MKIKTTSEEITIQIGQQLGALLVGGEVIELIGDVGSGKTTFVKGMALGLKIHEYIQSPSYNINRIYKGRDDITLNHYDYYRLDNAGIMLNELNEYINDPTNVTVIEWAGIVDSVLPDDRITIRFSSPTENSRILDIGFGGKISQTLVKKLKT